MENLKNHYAKYLAEVEAVWKERPAWDGVLGLGSSLKSHPCHRAFYESVEAWVDGFVKSMPTQQQAEAAAAYILEMPETYRRQATYWTMFAAHGLVKPLIPLVSPRFAGQMRRWYDDIFPRRDRTPVHKEVYRQLKKRERE